MAKKLAKTTTSTNRSAFAKKAAQKKVAKAASKIKINSTEPEPKEKEVERGIAQLDQGCNTCKEPTVGEVIESIVNRCRDKKQEIEFRSKRVQSMKEELAQLEADVRLEESIINQLEVSYRALLNRNAKFIGI